MKKRTTVSVDVLFLERVERARRLVSFGDSKPSMGAVIRELAERGYRQLEAERPELKST